MQPPARRTWLQHTLCLLLLLLQHAHSQQQDTSKQPTLVQPDYNIYHRMADVLRSVEEVANNNPQTMKVERMSATEKGYSADMMVITVEPGGLTEDHSKKARLLLDFGEHGREFITCEVGMELVKLLAEPARLAQALSGVSNSSAPRTIDSLINHVVFKILPMENVGGRSLVEKGALCERKNGRGVDPNRNWPVDWGKKEKDYDPSEEFPGERPLSEPEAQLVLSIAQQFKPHVWLNVHSGMEALFTPYDHKATVPDGQAAQVALQMLQVINHDCCQGKCVVGSGGKSVGYLAHGTATDYMYDVLHVPLAMTWEIYGDMKAHFNDCFRMFNPLGQKVYKQTVDKWVAAVLRLVELLPMHPSAAFLRAHVQDPAGAEQRQQQEQAVTDADTVQPGAGSKAARQGNSQPHSSGKVQQGGVQIEGGMQAVVSGAVEDLVVEVEQGRWAGRWKLWHSGLVALLAACVAVGAVLVVKLQGGAVGRVISSPRGHRAPRR